MNTQEFSAQQSLQLISDTIKEARKSFKDNGFIYIFWGILIALASFAQFYLLKKELYDISYYPYLLMPLGSIFTGFYYAKKKNKQHNILNKIVSGVWLILTINIFAMGFFFPLLKEHLIPIILLMLSIGVVVSGFAIKNNVVVIAGLFINMAVYICLAVDWLYHPLIMGITALVAILIPGLVLKNNYQKTTVYV